MLHRITFSAAILLLLFAAQPLLACQTPSSAAFYHGGGDQDFNDWGAIAMDADAGGWPTDCSKVAATTLLAKLKDMKQLPNDAGGAYFQQPLAGYSLALILAAGQRIAAHSWFNQAVDSNPAPGVDDTLSELFDWIIWEYDPSPSNAYPGCGTGFQSNSCMDDHAGRAAAHAWIAAYKSKRGDADTSTYISAAQTNIDDFFANVCMHNPTRFGSGSPTFCNGYWTELNSGDAKVVSFEHGFETPHYGLGLMTSIVQATVGLQAAGSDYTINNSSEKVAKALGMMREVQDHADSNFAYTNDCLNPDWDGTKWVYGTQVSCADQGYSPRMYHLNQFYQDKVGSTPTGTYQSDDTCCNTNGTESFWHLSTVGDFFGTGRFATYHDQGWTWYSHRNDANRYMPGDAYTPIGYVDSVASNGLVQGWACDKDAPNGWVKVDVYVNGVKVADDPNLNDQQAWWSSEQAVNNLCLGGSAHRFSFYLPPASPGTTITAYARDYTFGAAGQLTCSDCTY